MHCEPDDLCAQCWDDDHRRRHPEFVDGCFACKLDTITVDARIHADRGHLSARPRTPDNAWERGVKGEHRPGGTFMPYLNEKNDPVRVKEYGERRHEFEAVLKRRRAPATTS